MANDSSSGKRKRNGEDDEDLLINDLNDINVKSFTGKTLSLQVKGSDTLGNLKRMIRDKESIPISEQVLIYKEMVLEGIIILAEFGIKKGSLTLMRKSRGGSMMRIFVKNLRGLLIPLQVKLSDTIRDVKSQIQDYIPLDEKELIFDEMVLDDKSTLADFHINNDSTLTLLRISGGLMQIFVKTLNGVTISLRVKPSNTIADVKAYITLENDFSLYNYQVLTFKETVLEDSGTLFDYHIKNGSTLTATGLIKIFVQRLNGTIFSVECKRTDSVLIVKEKIHDHEGITPDRQKLVFRMRQIVDDYFTLADCHIYNESIIWLVVRQ